MDLSGQTVSLWEALLSVPDHRRSEGKRYPLASLLLIAIAALLAGRHDQLGIIRWGRRLSRDTLTAIGIGRARIPAPSVWCELFQDLDIVALEQALGAWVRGGAAPGHVAIDGKRLRGSATAHSPYLLRAQHLGGAACVRRDYTRVAGAVRSVSCIGWEPRTGGWQRHRLGSCGGRRTAPIR